MIDFSTLKSLTIPEGEVVKIEDTNGNVLWEKAPSTANVKITTPDSNNASFPNIIIDGVSYNDTSVEYELVVPIGTIVDLGGVSSYVNGIQTNQQTYTIMGDVEIQRYTHITPPSPPTSYSPLVTVAVYIIEL